MKKLIFYLPLCALIAVILFQFARTNMNIKDINEQEQYFRKINEVIKNLDFCSAKVKDGEIILYDEDQKPTTEIPFAEYDEKQKFIYARKSDDIVYFITGGAVDDEWGIMFVNDGSDSMMDGVGSATRTGGNSYEYTSMCKYYQ